VQKCAAFFVFCWNLEWCAYKLNSKPLVILNLFQDNKPALNIILKQVQDDDCSDNQTAVPSHIAFSRDSRLIKMAARFAWRLMLARSTVSPGAWSPLL
jgi:hypothetical protein